jgi:hypothetical protein
VRMRACTPKRRSILFARPGSDKLAPSAAGIEPSPGTAAAACWARGLGTVNRRHDRPRCPSSRAYRLAAEREGHRPRQPKSPAGTRCPASALPLPSCCHTHHSTFTQALDA